MLAFRGYVVAADNDEVQFAVPRRADQRLSGAVEQACLRDVNLDFRTAGLDMLPPISSAGFRDTDVVYEYIWHPSDSLTHIVDNFGRPLRPPNLVDQIGPGRKTEFGAAMSNAELPLHI